MSVDERTIGTVIVIAAIGFLPLLLMITTSFVKSHVVLSLLRSALGTGSVPSAGVLFAFAAVLAVIVMSPVAERMAQQASGPLSQVDPAAPLAEPSRSSLMAALEAARAPLVEFLTRNAGQRERALFLELARGGRTPDAAQAITESDLRVVLPAFLITELTEALQIGFVLLLPFLVVDLVVASVLGSLGMLTLAPSVVALPLKLLLFLSVDGFALLSRALVTGY
jgi:type III secretion protein R